MDNDFPQDELFEKLADIEHQRWSDWQRYFHSKCIKYDSYLDYGDMVIPREVWDKAERQINTDYKDLSEAEKNSDRKQVMRYWDLIKPTIKSE